MVAILMCGSQHSGRDFRGFSFLRPRLVWALFTIGGAFGLTQPSQDAILRVSAGYEFE